MTRLDAALEALDVGCQTADCDPYVPTNAPECLRCGADLGPDPTEDWCATCLPDVLANTNPSVDLEEVGIVLGVEGWLRCAVAACESLWIDDQELLQRIDDHLRSVGERLLSERP